MQCEVTSVYELTPRFERRKSFYGKATVRLADNRTKTLYSYGTPVVELDLKRRELHYYPDVRMSQTTRRHLREFLRQEGVDE